MKQYRVVLRGRQSTAATGGDWGTRAITIEAWDKGDAKIKVTRKIRNGYTINHVKCDHVVVGDIRSAAAR